MKKYDLKIVKKPKYISGTNSVLPEDLPALRRYQGVCAYMRADPALSEADAVARYDAMGTCKCGAALDRQRRVCDACQKSNHLGSARIRRAKKAHWKTKTCRLDGCEQAFLGHVGRLYCDTHTGRRRQKPRGPYKPRVPKAKLAKPSQVKNWEKRAKPGFSPSVAVSVETIINPGVEVERIPPKTPSGLRDFFGAHGAPRLATDDWGQA